MAEFPLVPSRKGRPTARGAQPERSGKRVQLVGFVVLLTALGLALAALVFAVQDWAARAQARKLNNPYPPSAEALAAGTQVYTQHCRSCHGAYGDGKGEKAGELSVAPGDFTDAAKMDLLSDGELYWQITKGHRPMPAFADKLNEQQRWQVVDYLRTFAAKAKGPPAGHP
ncbi:MAG TPA: cytochrome c [Candidatus Acidoferrales bacterium]|nr:cytochrome c [Candidatus Acidoferrales bacterium]